MDVRNRRSGSLIALVVAALALAANADSSRGDASEWTTLDSGEGPGFSYQVFSTRREGESFTRYEARGRVAASPEVAYRAARTVISDPAQAASGQTRRILPGSNDDEFFVHTVIDLPMPFSDMDIVARGVRQEEGETLRLEAEASEHPAAPPDEDTVRIESWAGSWSFAPAADGATRVVYATHSDAAGFLPGWLVDPLNERNVESVFEQFAVEAVANAP